MVVRIADCFGVSIDDIVGRLRPNESELTAYENALLLAARNADERARQDALSMLSAHSDDNKKEDLA